MEGNETVGTISSSSDQIASLISELLDCSEEGKQDESMRDRKSQTSAAVLELVKWHEKRLEEVRRDPETLLDQQKQESSMPSMQDPVRPIALISLKVLICHICSNLPTNSSAAALAS